jgi:hypothetical protein
MDAYSAAREIKGRPRSCISRAYYAAFSAVSDALDNAGVQFASDREGPSHQKLPELVGVHLEKSLGRKGAKDVKSTMRRLYKARLDADYVHSRPIGDLEARSALQDASFVCGKLGLWGASNG